MCNSDLVQENGIVKHHDGSITVLRQGQTVFIEGIVATSRNLLAFEADAHFRKVGGRRREAAHRVNDCNVLRSAAVASPAAAAMTIRRVKILRLTLLRCAASGHRHSCGPLRCAPPASFVQPLACVRRYLTLWHYIMLGPNSCFRS